MALLCVGTTPAPPARGSRASLQSLSRLLHTKLEDTKPEHLELSVRALDLLATKTLERER